MKTLFIIEKIGIGIVQLTISTCTNELVVHAKQVNYFEMFMLSLVIECKNNFLQNHVNLNLKNKLLKLYNHC